MLKQQLVSDEMYNVELLSVLCAIAVVYVVHNDYKHMISLVKKMNEILSVTMLQVYKPGISVFKAKCYLYFENDKKGNSPERQSYFWLMEASLERTAFCISIL